MFRNANLKRNRLNFTFFSFSELTATYFIIHYYNCYWSLYSPRAGRRKIDRDGKSSSPNQNPRFGPNSRSDSNYWFDYNPQIWSIFNSWSTPETQNQVQCWETATAAFSRPIGPHLFFIWFYLIKKCIYVAVATYIHIRSCSRILQIGFGFSFLYNFIG